MEVISYLVSEVDRQSGTVLEVKGMYKAYLLLANRPPLTEDLIHDLASRVKCVEALGYRRVPAVFNQGSPAIEASLIPNAMKRLISVSMWMTADEFVVEFLKIHPFADGNGRVASLLYNYMRFTLGNPVPLPYYFGEK